MDESVSRNELRVLSIYQVSAYSARGLHMPDTGLSDARLVV